MVKAIPGNFTLNFNWFENFCEIIEFEWNADKIYISVGLNKSNIDLDSIKDDLATTYIDFKKTFTSEVAFEELVKKLNSNYGEKLSWSDVIIALISWRHIFVTHSWDAECYLIRNNKLNVILESSVWKWDAEKEEVKNEELFVNMASWYLSNDDVLVFSTKRILRRFTSLQIIEAFNDWISEWLEMMKWVFENEEYPLSVSWIHIKMDSPFESRRSWNEKKWWNMMKYLSTVQDAIDNFIYFIAKKTRYPYETVQKWFVSWVWVLILILLVSMVAFSSQNSQKKALYDQYKIEILKVDKQLEVAESRSLMWSTSDANAILDKIEEKVSEILDSWMLREESIVILWKIEKMRDDINKITRFSDLETIKLADLSESIVDWDSILWLVNFNWFSYAYTPTKIYKISLNKVEQIFDFVEWNLIKDVTVMVDRWLILIFTESNALFEFDWANFEKSTVDWDSFKSPADFATYSRFAYLLESWESWTWAVSKWQIWKYQRNQSWYWQWKWYIEWEDFSNAVSIAIDWSIYILHKWWHISQYYSWKPVNFSYKWDTEIIKEATEIYTKLDYSNIYLLDKVNNKIIVLIKTNEWAEFLRQYLFDWDNITWLYVEPNEQEMTVSWKNKIYKISLIN